MAIIKVDYGEISGGGTVKTGTLEDITTTNTEVEIDTGVSNIKRFILICDADISVTYNRRIFYWDENFEGGDDTDSYLAEALYPRANPGYRLSGDIQTIGVANASNGTIVSIDKSTGIVKIRSASNSAPMYNIIWYAE